MAVKTIFKILICTIVLLVLISLILEVININTVGLQINQLSKIATRQACILYGQETYKNESIENTSDILGISGNSVISGDFYMGSDADEVYKRIYIHNEEFKEWAREHAGIWKNLDIMLMGMSIASPIEQNEDNWLLAESYFNNRMTPLNLGIPYLDKSTVENIMRWNLAAIFSNGQQSMIVDNDIDGRPYVKYKGFRIYVTGAAIVDIDYEVLDVTDSEGRQRFIEYTNIDPSKLGMNYYSTDERTKICVAGIQYVIPMAYEGITPFRKIMEYTWNNRVQGFKNENTQVTGGQSIISESDLVAGGLEGDNSLPVPGKLIYYIIK